VGLVAEQIKRYNVKVVGLQETKWFGNEMYKVGNAVGQFQYRYVTRVVNNVWQ